MDENLEPKKEVNNELSEKINKPDPKEKEVLKLEITNDQEEGINIKGNVTNTKSNLSPEFDKNNEDNDPPSKTITKPKKELPIEKKPFQEFVNIHLIPALEKEINQRGLHIKNIHLKNTNRPIAEDKCWVINCEIKDTCSFWLSFEKEDISSLKSISLSKPNQKPSIIESFLIDEKRITLKLIISRVLQRLNGQKLIGVN